MFAGRLLRVDAALAVRQCIAMEARGDLLVECGIGQQISGDLLDRKFVERKVAIEGFDYPIPVSPGIGTEAIAAVPVAVGIPRLIEPVARPFFAVMWRAQQPLHCRLVASPATPFPPFHPPRKPTP